MRATGEIDRAGAQVGCPDIGSAAGQVQRAALDVDGAGVVEQRGDRRGRRIAALGESASVVHRCRSSGVTATSVGGNDGQAAGRRLIIERRPTGDRQDAGTGIAHAGIRVGSVQTDLDLRPRCRAGPAKLQRAAAVKPKAGRGERCST